MKNAGKALNRGNNTSGKQSFDWDHYECTLNAKKKRINMWVPEIGVSLTTNKCIVDKDKGNTYPFTREDTP